MDGFTQQDLSEYFNASETGFWKMEMVNNVSVRLYVDENMRKLIGVPKSFSPEETCNFFISHINSEDQPLLLKYGEDMMKGNAEVVYRYNHPVNGEIQVRCGGRRTKVVGKSVFIIGYHKELSDIVRLENNLNNNQKWEEQLIRRNSVMQKQKSQNYYRDLMNKISCGIIAYSLNSHKIHFMNYEAMQLYGVKDTSEFEKNAYMLLKKTIYQDSSVIQKLLHLQKEDGFVDYECILVGLDGRHTTALVHSEVITTLDGERSTFSTILDISENKNLKSEKNLLDALCRDYAFVYECDLQNDTLNQIKIYRNPSEKPTDAELQVERKLEKNDETYSSRMKFYFDNFVDKETSADFVDKLNAPYLMENLPKNDGRLYYRYKLKQNPTGKENLEVQIVQLKDLEGFRVVMGFRIIDEILFDEKKRQKHLEEVNTRLIEQNYMIAGLSKEFTTVWLVSKGGDSCVMFQDTGRDDIARKAFSVNTRILHYQESMKEYVENFVCEEYQNEFIQKVEYENVLKEIKEKPVYSIIFRRNYNGKKEFFQISFALADITGKSNDFVMGFKNVDDVVLAEHKRNDDLAKALKAAENANVAKTQFLNNMSHDIRTPMNALLGYTKLMKDELKTEKALHYQEKIEQSGSLLLSIINNVLDMARIESGKMEIDENYCKVGSILKEICDVFEEDAQKKGLKIIREVHFKHNHIMCDITKIKEIFINLLSNAVKYTPNGGTIIVKTEELPQPKVGFVKFKTEVIDTGIGMSKEFLPTLFDSFTRERNTTVGKIAGTGLGMPIVKKLVEMMGGTIEVESSLGKGSKFTVIIEHRIADEVYYDQKAEIANEKACKAILKGKRILLAEDNDLNAEIAISILGEMGLIIDRVEDGIQCVSKMECEPAGTYGLILMDIQMPNMDGYKATMAIRRFDDKEKANIPILAMTANAFEEDRKMALERGMNEHIAKPLDMSKILPILAKYL